MKIKSILCLPLALLLLSACSHTLEDKRQKSFSNGLPQEQVKPITKPYPVDVLKLESLPLKDSDEDGVVDARDNCQQSVKDNMVDNSGCAHDESEIVTTDIAIYFDSGKSTFSSKYDKELARIAQLHSGTEDHLLLIEGYTDNRGTRQSNLLLSKQRANAVANRLVSKFSINKEEILIAYYGSDKPVASNDSKAGRQKNRRMVAHVVSTNRIVVKNWNIWSVNVGGSNTEVKEYYRLAD